MPSTGVVLYFGGVKCEPESVRHETVFARVPWGATSGPITLVTPAESVTGPWFTVITPCPDSMCLVSFHGPPVTRSTAMHYDPMYARMDSVPWTGRVLGDTVECVQAYPVGDDSHWTLTIRFRVPGPTGFPQAVEGILVRREIDGVFTDRLKGVVAVQDWDLSGVISGRISFVRWFPDGWYDDDFWYRFQ